LVRFITIGRETDRCFTRISNITITERCGPSKYNSRILEAQLTYEPPCTTLRASDCYISKDPLNERTKWWVMVSIVLFNRPLLMRKWDRWICMPLLMHKWDRWICMLSRSWQHENSKSCMATVTWVRDWAMPRIICPEPKEVEFEVPLLCSYSWPRWGEW
jgi:hypothetical protein